MRKKGICFLLSCALSAGIPLAAFGSVDYSNADTIKAIQQALNEEGYDCGTPDGLIGSGTKEAIATFRQEKNLPAGDTIDDDLAEALGYLNKDDALPVIFEPASAEVVEAMGPVEESLLATLQIVLTEIGVVSGDVLEYGNVSSFGNMVYVSAKISTDTGKTIVAECVHVPGDSLPWEVLYVYDFDDGYYYYIGDSSNEPIYDYKTGLRKERKASAASAPVTQETVDAEFYSSVDNDVTGRWRLAIVDTDLPVNSYVVNYYKTYFKSDDEIHGIINKHDNTTACVSVVLGMFSITVHKYVPGEENDAKLLFSGDVISDEFYNMETGQIEDF